jgi:hypothetical protein
MNKTWLSYLGSVFIFMAGILMLFAKRYLSGALFIVAAVAGVVIKYKMNRKH